MKFKCIAFLLPLVLLLGSVLAQDTQRPITVSINPNGVTMAAGETKTFTATLQPDSLSGVKWISTAGTIAGDGLTIRYTAPKISGTYFLRATSIDQPHQDFLASVTIARPQQQLTADQLKAVAAKGCAPAANDGYRFCATPLANPKYRNLMVLGWTNAGYYFLQSTEAASGDSVLLSVHNGTWTEIDRMASGNRFTGLTKNVDYTFQNGNSAGFLTADHPIFYYQAGGSNSYFIFTGGKKAKVLTDDIGGAHVQPNGDLYLIGEDKNGYATPIYVESNGEKTTIDLTELCEHKDTEYISLYNFNLNLRGTTVNCMIERLDHSRNNIYSEYVTYGKQSQRVYNSEIPIPVIGDFRFQYNTQGQVVDLTLFPKEIQGVTDYNPKLGYLGNGIITDGMNSVISLRDTYVVPPADGSSYTFGNLVDSLGAPVGFADDNTIIMQYPYTTQSPYGVYLLKPVK